MYIWIPMLGLLLPLVFFMYKIFNKVMYRGAKKGETHLPEHARSIVQTFEIPDGLNRITSSTNTNITYDYVWWKALGNLDQLHLALMLAHKALPIWNSYAASHDMVYKNSPTSPVSKIDCQLLAKALEELQLQSKQLFPVSNNNAIKQYYYHFVGPVIALQDGNWAPPYPVKKMFLSVYNILKSILEQDNLYSIENFLAITINQSLDCMDITKLYSKPEIAGFLQVYKNKL